MALFILVVLALLGVAIVTLGGVEHTEPLLSLQTKRAYWAAQSGLQWGADEALNNNYCPASINLASGQPGLNGLTVTVTCKSSTHTEFGGSFKIFDITAKATNGTLGNRIDFVQRKFRIIATTGP